MRSVVELIGHVLETDRLYGKYSGLFLLSLLVLFLTKNKEQEREGLFAGYSLAAAALAVCPLTVWLAVEGIGMSRNFWEMLWCIPAVFTLACAAVRVCVLQKKGAERNFLIAGCAVLIVLSGTVLPDNILPGNSLRTDPNLRKAVEAVSAQREKLGTDVVLLAPDGIMEKARTYDGRIHLLYGKDLWTPELHTGIADEYSQELRLLYNKMQTDFEHPDEVAEAAGWLGCNVLILSQKLTEGSAQAGRWELAEEIPGYCVIYRSRE